MSCGGELHAGVTSLGLATLLCKGLEFIPEAIGIAIPCVGVLHRFHLFGAVGIVELSRFGIRQDICWLSCGVARAKQERTVGFADCQEEFCGVFCLVDIWVVLEREGSICTSDFILAGRRNDAKYFVVVGRRLVLRLASTGGSSFGTMKALIFYLPVQTLPPLTCFLKEVILSGIGHLECIVEAFVGTTVRSLQV